MANSSGLNLHTIPLLPPINISSSSEINVFDGEGTYESSSSSLGALEDTSLTAGLASNSGNLGKIFGSSAGIRKSLSADSIIKNRQGATGELKNFSVQSDTYTRRTSIMETTSGRARKDKGRTRGGSLGASRNDLGVSIFSDPLNESSNHTAKLFPHSLRRISSKTSYSDSGLSNVVSGDRNVSYTELNLATLFSASTDRVDVEEKFPDAQPPDWENQNILFQSQQSIYRENQASKRIKIETENLRLLDFTIAIVGSKCCGKSSFIQKTIKHYMLEAGPWIDNIATISNEEIPYKYRVAIKGTDGTSDLHVKLLEVDSQFLVKQTNGKHMCVWPSELPRIDGVFVCYDASNAKSLRYIGDLLRGFNLMRLPAIVLACKSDLEKHASPQDALNLVQHLAGIIEVSSQTPVGKHKMHKSFDVLMRAIVKNKAASTWREGMDYRNPASPEVIGGPSSPSPWDRRFSDVMALTSSSSTSSVVLAAEQTVHSVSSEDGTTQSLSNPVSPTRARSTGDLLQERRQSSIVPKQFDGRSEKISKITLSKTTDAKSESLDQRTSELQELSNIMDDVMNENRESKDKYPPSTPWATLEELLDKLFFLSVSGDDPAFISHFFLTYRRFATPRNVLLGMQKRMLELNQPTDDFMLASFAQMRLCNLLAGWIKEYPNDFAVFGTAGALSAFTKQTLSHTHTLHYGLDFLPFIELLPTLVDEDAQWSFEVKDGSHESDESDGVFEENSVNCSVEMESLITTFIPSPQPIESDKVSTSDRLIPQRERKTSLPLSTTVQSILQTPLTTSFGGNRPHSRSMLGAKAGIKDTLTRLVKVAQHLLIVDAVDVAKEITRVELDLFLKMKPRHWLRHTLVSGRKNPDSDPIARFHSFYNYIHDWTVSLILCYDRPRARARQIEKFAEIANELRGLNNYSGLRAIVTAISNSTYPGDLPMELFKTKAELYKKFRSYDILLQSTGSHKSYRLALRNTKGPCIPALEVHMSDLLRAHEGNPDFKADDSTTIHWGKFNMIGKFIASTAQYQSQCRDSEAYKFSVNASIRELLDVQQIMDYDLQQSRISPPEGYEGVDTNTLHQTIQELQGPNRDVSGSRRRKFFR